MQVRESDLGHRLIRQYQAQTDNQRSQEEQFFNAHFHR
jgi:hypothetical protein